MLDAISAAQAAMLYDYLQLQTINQNISNIQTPSYKRAIRTSYGFDEQLQVDLAAINQQTKISQSQLQGTVTQTNNPHHLAIIGDGFFTVQTTEGIFYTRRGDFHVNERGELCLTNNATVLGKTGVIHIDDNSFLINKAGTLFINGQATEQFNIVRFEHPQNLHYLGEGLHSSHESPLTAPTETQLLQGFLEQSNVKSVDEMMELVKISRHFETTQRIMRIADNLLSSAIHQLGEGNV